MPKTGVGHLFSALCQLVKLWVFGDKMVSFTTTQLCHYSEKITIDNSTRCEELTHWERPWCRERLKAREGNNSGWDDWMASPTQWAWVWANSRRWWKIGKSGVLQSMGSQRVGHDLTAQQQQQEKFMNKWTWLHFSKALQKKKKKNSRKPDLFHSHSLPNSALKFGGIIWFHTNNLLHLTFQSETFKS